MKITRNITPDVALEMDGSGGVNLFKLSGHFCISLKPKEMELLIEEYRHYYPAGKVEEASTPFPELRALQDSLNHSIKKNGIQPLTTSWLAAMIGGMIKYANNGYQKPQEDGFGRPEMHENPIEPNSGLPF